MGQNIAIICNGQFPAREYPLYLIRTADKIVCCDGAFDVFMRNSVKIFGKERLPDLVIGDLDSISGSKLKKYRDVIVKVEEQENNDLTKAFSHIMENCSDITSISILGATGKREDHTIGNMSLLMEYAKKYELEKKDISVCMVSDYSTITAITDTCEISCGKGRSVSIISTDSSLRIKSHGLVWPTDDVVFDNLWKATLNRSSEDTVKLEFSHKSIALILLD